MTAKAFHLGDILSVTTGRLVSPRHMGGVYDILNWMTGEDLFTHQLPRACRECEGPLLARHPDLAAITVPEKFGDGTPEAVGRWLAEQVEIHGETREVEPLAAGERTRIDPLTEMQTINPDAKIIAVILPPVAAPDPEEKTQR